MRSRLAAAAALTIMSAAGCAPAGPTLQTVATLACPDVAAHRTLMTDRPENTVAGIQGVPATGAQAVEIDVQWSASGFPVLMHDATVDRTTDGTGAPATLGLGQLTALHAQDFAPWKTDPAYADVRVPYGWDFMNAASGVDLDVLVDIHAAPTQVGMEKLAHYLALFSWTDRTTVMASAERVAQMRVWQPDLTYAVIEYNPAATIRRGESARSTGATAYAVPARDVSPAAVDYWHAYGLRVIAWTSDSPAIDTAATWRQMSAAGVDVIVTNNPAGARAAVC